MRHLTDTDTDTVPLPSPYAHRLQNVDALRGFALLGILAVNIWAFADPYYATSVSNPRYDSALDHALRFVAALLFETKFYLLFSFLFGYSFTLQMAAAERAQAEFRTRMLRRLGGLLALGLMHGTLLYDGEILALYAVLGLILLACRTLTPARALIIGISLILLMGSMWLLLGSLAPTATLSASAAASAHAKLLAFRGTATTTLAYHAHHYAETAAALAMLQAPSALAMFLLGFAAGRLGLFARLEHQQTAMRRTLGFALPLGLAGALAYAWITTYAPGGALEILAFGLGQLTAPFLTTAYVVAGLMLFRTEVGRRVQSALAPMGKMALSNYLGQSMVLGVLFTGYGFGGVDRLPPLAILAVVPFIFLAQLRLSRWWLGRHVYGPGEWLLRAVTIARRPPWRRSGRPEAQMPELSP